MQISTITAALETWAPLSYQESYDNAGLIIGDPLANCTGILCSLDCTEAVVDEAIAQGCNLIVSHHPIVFKGIKQFTPNHYVTRVAVKAIKNNIALYAIHTNLDNIIDGVNKTLADKIRLENRSILAPLPGIFDKNGDPVGAGLVGALAYTFSDTFWFSAVEGEVYATSSLFTAAVFWAMLKWDAEVDRGEASADRWIILIAYLMGLSIGVHLLNLLTIPAIGLLYYYKKYKVSQQGLV